MQKLVILSIVVVLGVSAFVFFSAEVGKCYGKKDCKACTTCSSCKYCAEEGRTCGVCKK